MGMSLAGIFRACLRRCVGSVSENVGWGFLLWMVFGGRRCVGWLLGMTLWRLCLEHVVEHTFSGCIP